MENKKNEYIELKKISELLKNIANINNSLVLNINYEKANISKNILSVNIPGKKGNKYESFFI